MQVSNGLRFYVASAEDTLISKLEWSQMGESERQLRGAAGIIRTQGKNLDSSYIEGWVGKHDLENQWRTARELAGKDDSSPD